MSNLSSIGYELARQWHRRLYEEPRSAGIRHGCYVGDCDLRTEQSTETGGDHWRGWAGSRQMYYRSGGGWYGASRSSWHHRDPPYNQWTAGTVAPLPMRRT